MLHFTRLAPLSLGSLLLTLFAFGCGADPDPDPVVALPFPDGFHWGSATAGFQVDMGCPTLAPEACEDRASDWYDYVTEPIFVERSSLHIAGDPLSWGPGMWETFEEDVEWMAADGFTAYRMSLEWSRLFPADAEAADSVEALADYADTDAIARYRQMFSALRDAGIEPMVTLNHYTLPRWVHDAVDCHTQDPCARSGWVDGPRITRLIGLYAGFAGHTFGDQVDIWFTLNEPFATTLSGYLLPGEDRSAPPGRNMAVDQGVAVMLHQIEGHAAMYDAIHAQDQEDASGDGQAAAVGLVMNMVDFSPKDPDRPEDVQSVEHADYLYHRLYLDAVTHGAWDPDLDGVPDTTRADLAGRLDLIGINYYNEVKVTALPVQLIPQIPIFDFIPEFSWAPHPTGLGPVVLRAAEWGLPIYVTENGTPHVEDRGVEILDGHLTSLHEAIAQGADVRSYLYWSQVDNYEWNHGFDLRFGLYALDVETKARTPRAVLERYRQIIRANGIP